MDRRRLPLAVCAGLIILGAITDPPNLSLILIGIGAAIVWLALRRR